jgi:hypothetical protein
MGHYGNEMDDRPVDKRKSNITRCAYCQQIHTGGVSCNSIRGDWVGENSKGGAKPTKIVTKKDLQAMESKSK